MTATGGAGGTAGSTPEGRRNDDPVTQETPAYSDTANLALTADEAGRLMRRASYASVTIASLLILIKLSAWLITGSVAMLGSLMDSALDVGASIVNLLAIRAALVPADREHRFGHGKAEALAGLAQAAFVAGSAVFLILQAVDRLYRPRPISSGEIGIAVIVVSILLTLALVMYQRSVIRRTGSLAVRGDSLHYRGDLVMNLAVILALVLSGHLGLTYADPILAVAIAAYLLWGAWSIFGEARDHLMDRELPDELRQRIREIVLSHPKVIAMHDLRTRSAGVSSFIQLHIEMDPDMPLIEAHVASDEVEAMIRALFADAEVIIHQDPYGVEEERLTFPR